MLSDAYIEVTCDGCHTVEVIQLTATAKGWDERNVARHLESIGWLVDGECHYCEDCKTHHPGG
jgi:hypothetical protein